MTKKSKHATLSEVAKKAGVGTTTVSRVINGVEHVEPKTLARVQQAIKALGNEDGITWGLQTLPTQVTDARQPSVPDFDISLQKSTPVRKGMNFILRLDAFNAFNSVQFGGPDSNPGDGPPVYSPGSGWSGFGTINNPTQQNFPRILKVSGKITF